MQKAICKQKNSSVYVLEFFLPFKSNFPDRKINTPITRKMQRKIINE